MLYRLLGRRAEVRGEKLAVVGERRSLTFKQLFDEASATAAFFNSCGLRVGDAVMIGVPPAAEFYVLFYAAAAAGLVILPVLPAGRIPQLIVDRKPLLAAGDENFLARARKSCRALKHEIAWSREGGLELDRAGRFRRGGVFRDQCVIGVSSSGTTGAPSIYYRSQELLVRRAQFRAQSLGLTADDVLISARPFNSGSSINSHVVMPIVAGCKVVVHEQFRRFQAADAITRERVTVLYAVPFVFELLASVPDGGKGFSATLRRRDSPALRRQPHSSGVYLQRARRARRGGTKLRSVSYGRVRRSRKRAAAGRAGRAGLRLSPRGANLEEVPQR
jgi:long-chain acyl-CoA synthetase